MRFQQLLNSKLDDRSQDVCEKVFKRQSMHNSGTSLKRCSFTPLRKQDYFFGFQVEISHRNFQKKTLSG